MPEHKPSRKSILGSMSSGLGGSSGSRNASGAAAGGSSIRSASSAAAAPRLTAELAASGRSREPSDAGTDAQYRVSVSPSSAAHRHTRAPSDVSPAADASGASRPRSGSALSGSSQGTDGARRMRFNQAAAPPVAAPESPWLALRREKQAQAEAVELRAQRRHAAQAAAQPPDAGAGLPVMSRREHEEATLNALLGRRNAPRGVQLRDPQESEEEAEAGGSAASSPSRYSAQSGATPALSPLDEVPAPVGENRVPQAAEPHAQQVPSARPPAPGPLRDARPESPDVPAVPGAFRFA